MGIQGRPRRRRRDNAANGANATAAIGLARRRPAELRRGAVGGAARRAPAPATAGPVVQPTTLCERRQQVVGRRRLNHHASCRVRSRRLAPGASLGDVLTRVQKGRDDTLTGNRSNRRVSRGAAKAFESSTRQTSPCCSSLAIMVVYIVCSASSTRDTSKRDDSLRPAVGSRSARWSRCAYFRMDLNIYAFGRHDHLIASSRRTRQPDTTSRARPRAAARSGGSDLRRLPEVRFTADHDDDDGGVLGAMADRGRATGAAEKHADARACGRRRPLLFSQLVTLFLTQSRLHLHGQLQSG